MIDALLALLLILGSGLRIDSHVARTVLYTPWITVVNERDAMDVHWRPVRPDHAQRGVDIERSPVRPTERMHVPWFRVDSSRKMLIVRHAFVMSAVFTLILLRVSWVLVQRWRGRWRCPMCGYIRAPETSAACAECGAPWRDRAWWRR